MVSEKAMKIRNDLFGLFVDLGFPKDEFDASALLEKQALFRQFFDSSDKSCKKDECLSKITDLIVSISTFSIVDQFYICSPAASPSGWNILMAVAIVKPSLIPNILAIINRLPVEYQQALWSRINNEVPFIRWPWWKDIDKSFMISEFLNKVMENSEITFLDRSRLIDLFHKIFAKSNYCTDRDDAVTVSSWRQNCKRISDHRTIYIKKAIGRLNYGVSFQVSCIEKVLHSCLTGMDSNARSRQKQIAILDALSEIRKYDNAYYYRDLVQAIMNKDSALHTALNIKRSGPSSSTKKSSTLKKLEGVIMTRAYLDKLQGFDIVLADKDTLKREAVRPITSSAIVNQGTVVEEPGKNTVSIQHAEMATSDEASMIQEVETKSLPVEEGFYPSLVEFGIESTPVTRVMASVKNVPVAQDIPLVSLQVGEEVADEQPSFLAVDAPHPQYNLIDDSSFADADAVQKLAVGVNNPSHELISFWPEAKLVDFSDQGEIQAQSDQGKKQAPSETTILADLHGLFSPASIKQREPAKEQAQDKKASIGNKSGLFNSAQSDSSLEEYVEKNRVAKAKTVSTTRVLIPA